MTFIQVLSPWHILLKPCLVCQVLVAPGLGGAEPPQSPAAQGPGQLWAACVRDGAGPRSKALVPAAAYSSPGMRGLFLKFGQCFGLLLFGNFNFFILLYCTLKETYTTGFSVCFETLRWTVSGHSQSLTVNHSHWFFETFDNPTILALIEYGCMNKRDFFWHHFLSWIVVCSPLL